MSFDPLQLTIVVVYFALLIAVGVIFTRANRNTDDYFRSGCQGTWWLVGVSIFISNFSAWTFTGAASAAYVAGPAPIFLQVGHATGLLCAAWVFAAWFRQMRVAAVTEADRLRYGVGYAQVSSVVGVVVGLCFSTIQLYGLAIFITAMFGYPTMAVIVGVGVVVMLYSTFGGAWAGLANDFLQAMILLPFVTILGGLCLLQLGGVQGMFDLVEAQHLQDRFALLKPLSDEFGGLWVIATVVSTASNSFSISQGARYSQVKDGREARGAALLAAGLLLLDGLIWYLQPMTARLLFAAQVEATPLDRPTEASFAVAALQLMPPALSGLLVVALFGATMGSMDTGLNRAAGIIVRVIYPFAQQVGRWREMSENGQVVFSRWLTVGLGSTIIVAALALDQLRHDGLIQAMQAITAISTAFAVPGILGLFWRRIPGWAPFATIGVVLIPVCLGVFSRVLFGVSWSFELRLALNLGTGLAVMLLSLPFYRYSSAAYRERVEAFFTRLHTPVDFAKEVGQGSDTRQLLVVGSFGLLVGGLILLLVLVPASPAQRWITASVGTLAGTIGLVLLALGWRARRREARCSTVGNM